MRNDLVSFFADMALDLHSASSSEGTLALSAEYAMKATGCDAAGIILVHGRGRMETSSGTDDKVIKAHDLQIEFGEGPCIDAIDGPDAYIVTDASTDARWPTWGPAVAELGYRSVASIRLSTHQRRYGSLNVYDSRPDYFTTEDAAVTKIFAAHASVALAARHNEEHMTIAMDARKLIGQAQGILMERFDIESDRAFEVLARYSSHNNIKLNEVARFVVSKRDLPVESDGAATAAVLPS